MIREAIAQLVDGVDLSAEQAASAMNEIMSGECTESQVAAFMIALRIKGETAEEIAGCARVMREKATRVQAPAGAIDVVGTGGDNQRTFNISTASAFVAAGGGAFVAKHGNRSVSSTSGAADVLKALEVNIDAEVGQVETCISEAGIGFLFAPRLHGAMKHAIGPRREIGVRTVFNILGPLTNPAGATRQILGVYASSLAPTLAAVLQHLGAEHALVVHGHDGLDEITIADETTLAELKDGEVREYVIAPEDFGLTRTSLDPLRVENAESSAEMIRGVLAGNPGPARDIVLLNAGAALYVAGVASDLQDGVDRAAASVDEGKAKATLERLVEISNR